VTRRIRTAATLFQDAIARCVRDDTPTLAAALAFYSLLSLAPALWLVVETAGRLIGRESARAEVIAWVTDMTGSGGAMFVGGLLDKVASVNPFATAAGVVSLVFGATGAFSALQDSLNRIWGVPDSDRGFLHGFFMKRLFSFLAVLLAGILLLAAVLVSGIVSAAIRFSPDFLPAPGFLLRAADFAIVMIMITLLFAIIYRILPDKLIDWHDVWTGAVVTAGLFSAGKTLIGMYLSRTSFGLDYGAAGSLVVLLLWVYYSALIFLLGAELTAAYASARIPPMFAPQPQPATPREVERSGSS